MAMAVGPDKPVARIVSEKPSGSLHSCRAHPDCGCCSRFVAMDHLPGVAVAPRDCCLELQFYVICDQRACQPGPLWLNLLCPSARNDRGSRGAPEYTKRIF